MNDPTKQDASDAGTTGASKLRLTVGLGASAGGLAALEAFFDAMPARSGLAFVVVSHHLPDVKSMMPELLARHTTMKVELATHGTLVEANHVYVAHAGIPLSIVGGALVCNTDASAPKQRLPIDHFLRSLAKDQGNHAAAVILSGTGSDGTLGAAAVKNELGLTLAQEPSTAQFAAMPQNAIASAQIDHVVAPAKMAQVLIDYADALAAGQAAPSSSDVSPELDRILTLINSRTGHDFRPYKANTITRRIQRRMFVHHARSAAEYLELLATNPTEVSDLAAEMLIGVTCFFRDPASFLALKTEALPALLRSSPARSLRVWVPGCSTGEEAYSLAILIAETLEELKLERSVQIFATDLDARAIDQARAGSYPLGITADVSEERLARYFVLEGSHYRVVKQIREMVVLAVQNVISDPPFLRVDLVSCRNLLIYLEPKCQQAVLARFHYALNPGGVLLLGSSETLGALADGFVPIEKRANLFQKKDLPVQLRMNTSLGLAQSARVQSLPSHSVGVGRIFEEALARELVPPGVIIDADGNILHVHGHTRPFLEPAPGDPKMNLFRMAVGQLRAELPLAVRRAALGKSITERTGLHIDTGSETVSVDIRVQPLTEPTLGNNLFVVTFERRPTPTLPPAPLAETESARVAELERALASAKETLAATIEEYETANEELKVTVEEHQSMNEELQSTNEELETAKEEQQSLNEELQTVNAEFIDKIDTLSQAHDDMRTLLDSTKIAMLFLDAQLRIKRFTQDITRIAHIITSDIGRPISDLTAKIEYKTLAADAQEVLRTLIAKETEVRGLEGSNFLLRIVPYRTARNLIDGVAITFVDITKLTSAERRLSLERDFVDRVVRSLQTPVVALGPDLKILVANAAFLALFQLDAETVQGQIFFQVARGLDTAALHDLLENRLPQEGRIVGEVRELELPSVGTKKLRFDGERLAADSNSPVAVVLSLSLIE